VGGLFWHVPGGIPCVESQREGESLLGHFKAVAIGRRSEGKEEKE
jgi:hypothetical protein